MFEHLQEISERASIESMTRTAEQFLDNHPIARARDLYRWLWEGEFGPGTRHQPTRLDELTQMIRTARMHKSAGLQPMWEPLGLTCRFVHVNLIPYSDAGCPLKRILSLGERTRDYRADQLRFKMQWAFMKTQIIHGMRITVEEMVSFENDIAFHMTPEISFTDEYLTEYGSGYMVVPYDLFFETYPEYAEHES